MAAVAAKFCCGGCVCLIGNDLCAFAVETSYLIVENYNYD